MPFGSEASEAEVVDVASARVPLADILVAGKASGTWKLCRPDKLGQVRFQVQRGSSTVWATPADK